MKKPNITLFTDNDAQNLKTKINALNQCTFEIKKQRNKTRSRVLLPIEVNDEIEAKI